MKRIVRLDGIRAVAFLMVFLRHAFDIPLFWAGVDIFFVLSGFLITSILLDAQHKDGAWAHFYERRALRILPTYAVCLGLATFFFRLHWGGNFLWYAFFGMNIAESWHFGVPGLGILWSLAVEEQFYLFWPFVALRCSQKVIFRFAIALVIAAPLLRGAFTHVFKDHWPIYYLTPFRMDLIAAGAAMAILWRERGELRNWRRAGVGLTLGAAILFLACMRLFPNFNANSNVVSFNVLGYTLICCMATGLIAYTLGTEKGLWMWLMTAKPIRWIGLVSYTSYLVHAGALGLIRPFTSRYVNVAVAFACVVAYASLSWLLLEKPILRSRPTA